MDFSFQLYSARNFPPLDNLLSNLSTLGYAQVEGYGEIYGAPAELANALKSANITMPSGHFGLDQLLNIKESTNIAKTIGIQLLICPWLEPNERPTSENDWRTLSKTLDNLANSYAETGFSLAWHNHDFEFLPLASGALPMDILLQNAPNLGWQFDIAWSVKAGQNPIEWIEKYGSRLVSAHLKDIAPEGTCQDEDGWADLGQGTMDWPAILTTLRAHTNCNSFIMEHDNPNDINRFASISIAAAKKMAVKK